MKKKSKLEKLTPFVLGTCMLTLVAACGSDDDDSGSGTAQQPEQQSQEGEYRVRLLPVNPTVANSGTATGEGTFTIQGDEFRAVMNVRNAPNAEHPQHIHVGNRCATAADDTNGDGIIDAVEASAATGSALVPLDADLRAQDAGENNLPSGAGYSYNESTSLLAMLADLRLPDTDTADDLVKLPADEELNLAGKVVEVHGVPANTTLPGTVQASDDMSAQESLPILCGVIERVSDGGTGTTTGGTGTTTGGTGTTTGTTGTTGTTTTTGTTGTTGTTTTTGGTGTTTGTTGTTGTTTGTTGGTGTTTTGTTGTTGTTTTTGGTGTTTGGTGTTTGM